MLATSRATENSALQRILEAYIETLKAENESLKRQLAARERCPWWCRRLAKQSDHGNQRGSDPDEGGVLGLAPAGVRLAAIEAARPRAQSPSEGEVSQPGRARATTFLAI